VLRLSVRVCKPILIGVLHPIGAQFNSPSLYYASLHTRLCGTIGSDAIILAISPELQPVTNGKFSESMLSESTVLLATATNFRYLTSLSVQGGRLDNLVRNTSSLCDRRSSPWSSGKGPHDFTRT
jgi:hypothetical protein